MKDPKVKFETKSSQLTPSSKQNSRWSSCAAVNTSLFHTRPGHGATGPATAVLRATGKTLLGLKLTHTEPGAASALAEHSPLRKFTDDTQKSLPACEKRRYLNKDTPRTTVRDLPEKSGSCGMLRTCHKNPWALLLLLAIVLLFSEQCHVTGQDDPSDSSPDLSLEHLCEGILVLGFVVRAGHK